MVRRVTGIYHWHLSLAFSFLLAELGLVRMATAAKTTKTAVEDPTTAGTNNAGATPTGAEVFGAHGENLQRTAGHDALEAKLVALRPGTRLCVRQESHLQALLDKGTLLGVLFGDLPEKIAACMSSRDCHKNAHVAGGSWAIIEPPKDDTVGFGVFTGYALSGSIWRQHSWLVRGGKLYETTVRCEAYFGIPCPCPNVCADFANLFPTLRMLISRQPNSV